MMPRIIADLRLSERDAVRKETHQASSVENGTYLLSQRKGINPNQKGLPLADLIGLFGRVFEEMRGDGYFHEAFGFECVDAGYIDGKIRDIELEILLSIRKKGLWPISSTGAHYSEDDFFDVIGVPISARFQAD